MMMRNRGPRGPAMNAGSGLLGEGPGMGAGMKRMMAGVGGGGLLGSGPNSNRIQQPRSLLDRPDIGAGLREQQNMRGGLLEQHHLRERQVYNQGGRMEQQADIGYYEETGGGYAEEQGQYQQEYEDPNAGVYDQGRQEPYDSQEADYGYNYNSQQGSGLYKHPVNNPRGILDDPPVRGSLMGQTGLLEEPDFRQEERGMRLENREQRYEERGLRQQDPGMRQRQTGGFQGKGLLEAPAEQRGLLRRPDEQRGVLRQSRDLQGQPNRQPAQQRGLLDAPRGQRGLLDPPREHGFFDPAHDQRGLLERPGLDLHIQEHGVHDYPRDQEQGLMEPPSLMDMAEPPRPPKALILNEPRGLMDTPVEPRGLLDSVREPRSLMDKAMNQRGLMDAPRENRGQRDQRAPLDFPREQKGRNRPRTKQSELMEKADLQMKLLQQEKLREMEQMEQMNLLKQQQQALLLQHQQQHLQQVQQQQQQQLQQQLQIKQQMQQAEMIMNASKGQQRSGAIPSLLDMPTRGKSSLGKRPNAPAKRTDNKRARTGPADRRDRRPSQLGRKDTSRDRSGGRHNDRNRRGRKLSRNTSPDYKKRDRKDSGSRSSSSKKTTPSRDRGDKRRDSRNDRGKDKNEKEKNEKDEKDKDQTKVLPKTEVTVTMSEEYDPAEPTEDVAEVKDEVKEEVKKEDSTSVEKMDVGEAEVKKDEAKDGQQKSQEISLTVTVNKKGRSVNDAHQKDSPKQNKEKMYKCNVCSVECYDEESFGRHMNGKKHSDKMKIVMSSTSQQAVFIKSRLQAEEHLRQIEGQKRSPNKSSGQGPIGTPAPKGKALESHCKVCDKKFTGAYKDHKETPDHKNKKRLNSEDDEEELSELVTLDTVGFEDDLNADKREKAMETESTPFVKPLPVNTSTPKASVKPVQLEQVTPVKADEEDAVIPETYDPKLAVGKRYVVPVSGFFCKLCHKFYNNESAAKVAHCQSEAHYEKLKKAIAAKRAKSEEKAKKMEVSQPQFDNGTQSEDKNSKPSQSNTVENGQSNTVENGNQSGDEAANMEEPSQYETADESQDSTVDAGDSQNLTRDQDESSVTMEEEGESTVSDVEAGEGSQSIQDEEEEDDKKSSATEIKQQRARRGGGTPRGSARGRRGRK